MEAIGKTEPLRWQIRTVGTEGFELGLDVVTPVSWRVVRSRLAGQAVYALTLPEPDTDAYRNWLKESRGREIVASVNEIKKLVQQLRATQ